LKTGVPSHLRSDKSIDPIGSEDNVSNIRISIVAKDTDALFGVFDSQNTAIEDNYGLVFQTFEQDLEHNLRFKKYSLVAKSDNVSKRVEKISEFHVVSMKKRWSYLALSKSAARLSDLSAVVRPYNIALRWGHVRFDLIVNSELVQYAATIWQESDRSSNLRSNLTAPFV
jgi:hypothetical protein